MRSALHKSLDLNAYSGDNGEMWGSQQRITVDLHTEYPIIAHVLLGHFRYKPCDSQDADWDLCWTDLGVTPDTVGRLKAFQKINHFPNMACLSRKNQLARNLVKMHRMFGKEYEFFPQTWLLPGDWNWLRMDRGGDRTYIVKPEGMSQGRGIYIAKEIEEINSFEHCVVQRYIGNPYLIEGLKFDLRVYVLVYGCDPLRIYVFKEGLARFSTENYSKPTKLNIQNQYIHLTNYAINKKSKNFVFNSNAENPEVGHKRSLSFIWNYIDTHGGDSSLLRANISDIVVKTLCAVQPQLSRCLHSCQPTCFSNSMCFEVLGFDILVDDALKPWLLEVNHAPSFAADTPFDLKVKSELVSDVVTILHLDADNRKKCLEREKERQSARIYGTIPHGPTREEKDKIRRLNMIERDKYEADNCGGFEKVYPNSELEGKYSLYLDLSLIHICRCRRYAVCRSRWSPYH
eukprot:TRINITY_DN10164_c0_g2_i1.p1 TRINITY_DN10164_c0_g2~~TRINITY_DN10164_c0_g2_i1.p1  ORF type:complete len:459 (-),score=120.87 TRINITY_DN10164_c0_g2_i1:15-1391(-)